MQFDESNHYFVIPDFLKLPVSFFDLEKLMQNPLATKYLADRDDWFELGHSHQTRNFEMMAGPFGNGIIRRDNSVMTDCKSPHWWLPAVVLRGMVDMFAPPGIGGVYDRNYYGISYAEAHPSDDELLAGGSRQKPYSAPKISVEPLDEDYDGTMIIAVGITKGRQAPKVLKELPVWLMHFDIKSDLLDNTTPRGCEGIAATLERYGCMPVWYHAEAIPHDAGHYLAVLLYFGCHLRSLLPRRVKTIHMAAYLPGRQPMCPKWNAVHL